MNRSSQGFKFCLTGRENRERASSWRCLATRYQIAQRLEGSTSQKNTNASTPTAPGNEKIKIPQPSMKFPPTHPHPPSQSCLWCTLRAKMQSWGSMDGCLVTLIYQKKAEQKHKTALGLRWKGEALQAFCSPYRLFEGSYHARPGPRVLDGWSQRRTTALTHPQHATDSQLQHTDLAQNLLHKSTEYL